MPIIAGQFTEVMCQHPTAGDFKFDIKSGEDSEMDLGGDRIVDEANNKVSSGKMIVQFENATGYVQFTCGYTNECGVYIQALISASGDELGTFTITHIDGSSYIGKGTIVGDVKPNRNAGTIQLKAAFEGEVQVIS